MFFIVNTRVIRPYPLILMLGFGKDKFTGTYKLVWLYNSYECGLDNVTTCEVFDFSTHAWRYAVHASPYPGYHEPVYLDGSLNWFTEEKTKIFEDLKKFGFGECVSDLSEI